MTRIQKIIGKINRSEKKIKQKWKNYKKNLIKLLTISKQNKNRF